MHVSDLDLAQGTAPGRTPRQEGKARAEEAEADAETKASGDQS